MRRFLHGLIPVALLLTVAGCGAPRGDSNREGSADGLSSPPAGAPTQASSDRATMGPDVAPTAAPGVAFTYRHAFALEAQRIAEVQESHAQACEALGVSRCRVTGMSYRRINEHEIEGMLQSKLEPSLARRFGRVGLETVQQAGGILVESQISGTDVGTGLRANDRSIAQLREDLQRIERQLADPNIPASQKTMLRSQAEALRQQIRAIEENREEQQESLATTPVTFLYGTDEDVGNRPNWGRSLREAGDGFVWGLYGLMVVLARLLPWIVLGGLIWFLVRLVRRRVARGRTAEHQEAPETSAT